AIHPDFGWIWREDEDGGKLRLRAAAAEKREERLRAALVKIADTESTEGYLRDIRGGNAEIARAALADGAPVQEPLLKSTNYRPHGSGCNCQPGRCMAPVIMGR